ncbi:MAG: nucleoside recognition domain-containing protein [Butyricicoccaceae bacterium]
MQILSRAAVLLLFAALVRFSPECANAAREAVTLCLTGVVPSLFPFFAVSSMMQECGLTAVLGRLGAPLMRLYRLPGCCAVPLMLGFTAGYPVGARTCAQLYRDGQLTEHQAVCAAALCNNTGPAFLIGLCGTGIFGSLRAGLLLYTVHIVCALLVGLLVRPSEFSSGSDVSAPQNSAPLADCIVRATQSALQSILQVCAFVLLFSVILCILRCLNVIHLLSLLLSPFFSPLGLGTDAAAALLTGCVELTQGISALSPSLGDPCALLPAAAFLCGFGGISVLFQTKTVLDGLPVLRCVLAKLAHGIGSFALCRVILRLDLSFFQPDTLPPLALLAALALAIPVILLFLPVFLQNLWKTLRQSCIIDRNPPKKAAAARR